MLRSYWLKNRKAVGLTAFFVVAASVTWLIAADLSTVSSALQQNAADNSRKYTEDTKDYITRRCVGLLPVDQENCTREAEDARDSDQRVEFDLAAQQVTAWWTKIMGISALIGMGVSIVGVFLVWTTFAETRKANKIATDSFELAYKPWLIPRIEGDYLQLNKTNFDKQVGNVRSIHARVWVENYGEMPATIISSEIFLVGGEPSGSEPMPTFHVLTKGGAFSIGEDQRAFEASRRVSVLKERYPEIGRFIITPEFAKGGFHDPPKIVCRIEYLDPAGNTRELGFAFRPSAAWTNDFKRWGDKRYNYDRKLRAPEDK